MARRLAPKGYFCSIDRPDECRLWVPDFRNEVDFYSPSKKIANCILSILVEAFQKILWLVLEDGD